MSDTQDTQHDQQHLIDLFVKVAETQDQVNQKLVGPDWVVKAYSCVPIQPAGVVINYYDAMLDEASELFRSAVPFKWWTKNEGADLDNSLIELVDILHFLVSQGLVDAFADDAPNRNQVVAAQLVDEYNASVWIDPANDKTVALRSAVRGLIESILEGEYHSVMLNMWYCVRLIGVQPEAFANMYFAKAELNGFRKQHGYKEGTYIKEWLNDEGEVKEDNAVLNAFVKKYAETNSGPCPAEVLHKFMTDTYQATCNRLGLGQ